MKLFYIPIILLLSNYDVNGQEYNTDDLLSVVVIFRHGDRNPEGPTYPTDPYKDESNYPEGFGQLIEEGMERHFELGKWLRERYDGFLPKKYNVKDIHVRSTDLDRTLMSAVSNLGGLYSGNDSDSLLQWQPIPIHTVPRETDGLLMEKDCPVFNKNREVVYQEYFSQYDDVELFEYISNNTGSNITNLMELIHIYDTLFIQKGLNFQLPEWVENIYDTVMPLFIKCFSINCWTKEQARLKSGLFFNTLIENFQETITNPNGTYPKLLMYSAHDTTLGNILTAMGAFDDELIFYADSIIFELSNNGIINTFYKKQSGLKNITLNGCDLDCPLDAFTQILSDILITEDELNQECEEASHF